MVSGGVRLTDSRMRHVQPTALILVAVSTLVSGCSTVEAWEKGNLARPEMTFRGDPLDDRFTQHIYASKENASGGYSVGGGGCGCN
jgi:hypothetical protein